MGGNNREGGNLPPGVRVGSRSSDDSSSRRVNGAGRMGKKREKKNDCPQPKGRNRAG